MIAAAVILLQVILSSKWSSSESFYSVLEAKGTKFRVVDRRAKGHGRLPDQVLPVLALLRVPTLRSVEGVSLDEGHHGAGVHGVHRHPTAPGDQG